MEQNISYSLILTKDQADYLSASKQGINRNYPTCGSATGRRFPGYWIR